MGSRYRLGRARVPHTDPPGHPKGEEIMTERTALAYLYWPIAALTLYTLAQASIIVATVQGWF